METDIGVKRIYEPPSPDDGARILVDGVWPRGVSKQAAVLTLWLREVAPSAALRRWFGHEPARWAEFRRRYRAELAANPDPVDRLRDFLSAGRVTLLYAARDEVHNNARALVDYLHETEGKRRSRRSA